MDPGAVQAPRMTLDARTYGAGLIEGIGAGYEALTSDADVRAEALVRFGYHLIRVGERQRAVETFSEALKAPADPLLQYWSYFFRGWVLHRQGDHDAAERDYREALRLHPASRQVKTLLAGIVAERGDRAEAREILGDALKSSVPPDDPWMMFHQGDYRFWPERMVALRGAIR
jgi:Tfp pilus assembly protein PilF